MSSWLKTMLIALCLLCLQVTKAQFSEPDEKIRARTDDFAGPVESSYMFPIKPGEPASLAGTMGELRNTHFHSGIDIRTYNQIGWPVYAANHGYISRASISPSGFGLALYVTHPDGNISVYGHLYQFNSPVDEYVRQERYRRKTSSIDLYFRKDQFKVNKGDTIAFAGNSGSSAGPHLHFDIREGKNLALDPLKFKFDEVIDHTPPVVRKVAFKTLDIHSRINDQFGRFEFYVTRVGNNYVIPQPILAYGNIGIELLTYDVVDNPRYKCGVNYIEMFADSQRVFMQTIEKLNLNESRSIYTLMDYKTLRLDGNRFYKLYIDDGNRLDFYPANHSGRIQVRQNKLTPLTVLVKDSYGNSSSLQFSLQYSEPAQQVQWLDLIDEKAEIHIQENTLVMKVKTCNRNTIAYAGGEPQVLTPAYLNSATSVFLLDLRNGIPDSISLCTETFIPHFRSKIIPGAAYSFYSDHADISFPKNAIYDTLYFSSAFRTADNMELFDLGNATVPVNHSIKVSLNPGKHYHDKARTGVYRVNGKGLSYEGGVWQNARLSFLTREFGTFTILTDTLAPAITPIQVSKNSARLKIRDNLSGISAFEASINDQWVLLNYDEKTGILATEPAIKGQQLTGDFKLIVTDNAGNKQVYQQKIL